MTTRAAVIIAAVLLLRPMLYVGSNVGQAPACRFDPAARWLLGSFD